MAPPSGVNHQHSDDDEVGRNLTSQPWWPIVELMIGGGLFVSICGVAFGSIWYFAIQDATLSELRRDHDGLQQQVNGLDNVSLATRITILEGSARRWDVQLDKIEGKIDRLRDEARANRSP